MAYKLDHVGHIVKNFDEALKLYKDKFGVAPEGITQNAKFGSKMAFFTLAGSSIELIEPNGPEDPATRCLKERGEGLFHLAIRVDDFDATIKEWRKKGFKLEEYTIPEPERIVRIAFLDPKETLGLWLEFMSIEIT